MSNYISSIVNKYGDRDKVPDDCRVLFDILNRQGSSLLVDCLAEYSAARANKFELSPTERWTLRTSLLNALKSALAERL